MNINDKLDIALTTRGFKKENEDVFIKRWIKRVGVMLIQVEIFGDLYLIYLNKYNAKKFLLYKTNKPLRFVKNFSIIIDTFESALEVLQKLK